MKQIFKFMMIAAAASMFAACDEKPIDPVTPEDDETPKDEVVELNQNLEFTLEVSTLEVDNAKISISHNGTTSDTWYGFVTSEVAKSDDDLIKAEVAALTASGNITGLKKQTSTTVTARGLEPETDYKYIAFGLSEKGEVYGKSKSVAFKTLKAELQYTENAAWTVAYEGAGTIGNYNYEHTVSVTSTDNNYYFVTAATVEDFTAAGIKTIAESNLKDLKDYIDAFNAQNGTSYKVVDILFKGNGLEAVNLEAGDWYGIAIGVDEKGELTGLYAKSEVISIVEEEMTEEYAAWIGDWTFTASNGIAWPITFSKGKANQSYMMSGWEGEATTGLEVEVTWFAEDGMWAIFSQNLGTYNFGSYGDGEVWFSPIDAEGYVYPVEEIPICVGGFDEDGNRVIIGYSEETEEGIVEMVSMRFLAKVSAGLLGLSETKEFPLFPILITPATATTAVSSNDTNGVQVFTQMPKVLKISDFSKAYMVR